MKFAARWSLSSILAVMSAVGCGGPAGCQEGASFVGDYAIDDENPYRRFVTLRVLADGRYIIVEKYIEKNAVWEAYGDGTWSASNGDLVLQHDKDSIPVRVRAAGIDRLSVPNGPLLSNPRDSSASDFRGAVVERVVERSGR